MTATAKSLPAARAAAAPLKDASKALLETWKILRKRWLWVVTLTISTVAIAAFYTAGQQRIYRATCVIQIDPRPPKPLGQDVQAVVDVGSGAYWSNAEYYKTQFQIIQSRTVAEETVRRLGLNRDAAFLLDLSPKDAPPADVVLPDATVERAAQRVRLRLSVDPVRDSRLVNVSYQDPNPERARKILAALVSVYIDRNIDVALDSTNSAADWLRGQVDNLKQELEGTELALHEYKKDNRILSVSLDDQSNMLRQEMQQLSAALTSARVRRTQVAAQTAELEGLERGVSGSSASDQVVSESIRKQRDLLEQAVSERDSLLGSGKGEMHPLVISASARVQAAQAALDREIQNVKEGVERDLAVVDHEITSLATLFEQAQQRALSLGRLEIDYRRLERGKTNTEKLYSLVLEKSKESQLTGMARFNNIQVIDAPVLPEHPVSPRVPLNMALGTLCGVALGLIGAFGRDMFDQSVKSAADVEELGITFLGLLPRLGESEGPAYGGRRGARRRPNEERHAELVVHEDSTSAVSEAARGIRTNLAFMSPDKPFRTLLVTSGGPSEGKTTVACWLAIAMAQAGHRVVLVDCDLRRPRLHKVFDLVNDRGVTSALIDRSTLCEAVQPTQVPGLSVMLSGPSSPSPAETLQSKSFEALLADLAASYDRVVIDSSPVGPVTDAVVLSTRVDATLLVIRALSSARDMVRQAQRLLQDVRANIAGAVLNAAEHARNGYPYYRYYGRHEPDELKRASKDNA